MAVILRCRRITSGAWSGTRAERPSFRDRQESTSTGPTYIVTFRFLPWTRGLAVVILRGRTLPRNCLTRTARTYARVLRSFRTRYLHVKRSRYLRFDAALASRLSFYSRELQKWNVNAARCDVTCRSVSAAWIFNPTDYGHSPSGWSLAALWCKFSGAEFVAVTFMAVEKLLAKKHPAPFPWMSLGRV